MPRLSVAISAVVALFALGCGGAEAGPSTPAAPTPPVIPNTPSALVVRTVPGGAQVGQALKTQPVIEVQDAAGRVSTAAALPITVAIATPGITLRGTTTVTSATGVAAFNDVTLSGASGAVTLTFSGPGLPSVSASVTLAPGVAQSLKLITAPEAIVPAMLALQPQPVVQAVDEAGNATAAALTIEARIREGFASVVGGSTAVTDANGRAAFSKLTLGTLNTRTGPAVLEFVAPGINPIATPVTIGCVSLGLQFPVEFNGIIAAGDCGSDGIPRKDFLFPTFTSQTALRLVTDGSAPVASYVRPPNDQLYWGFTPSTGTRTDIKVIMPAGTMRVRTAPMLAAPSTTFSLSAQASSEDVAHCEIAFVGSPFATTQQTSPDDCDSNGFKADAYYLGLPAGASVTVTMTGKSIVPYLSLWRLQGSTATNVAAVTNAGQTITVTHENTSGSNLFYFFYATANVPQATGRYDLSVTINYPLIPGERPVELALPSGIGLHRTVSIPRRK
jgi:hypothetical protein